MHLLAVPALSDNYIWMLADRQGRAVIVDPGEAGPALSALEMHGWQPVGILLTHHHPDHIGGTSRLRERWPEMPVIAPDDDRINGATRRVGDGDQVVLGDWCFEVMAVPGHTLSHIAFHLPASDIDRNADGLLFSGDTLFSLGCGRLFEGSPAQMLASLSRLAALPDRTRVCCGHEYTLDNAAFGQAVEPDNQALRRRTQEAQAMRDAGRPSLPGMMQQEREANPFLRVDEPTVRRALSHRLGRDPADSIEAFAELRAWKDGFRA